MTQTVSIDLVKPNPDNPRFILDERFEQLVDSIRQFPEMLSLRPLVVDEEYVVLGGNMRLKALQELGYTEVPITVAHGLTADQKREFVIKDNASFGSWDMEALANNWGELPLNAWGLDLPKDWLSGPEEDAAPAPLEVPISVLKITFVDAEQLGKAQAEIQKLLDRKYKGAELAASTTGKLK